MFGRLTPWQWRIEGIQQGIQQGIVKNAQEDVIDILETRFGVVPGSIVEIIKGIYDPSILKIVLTENGGVYEVF